MSEEERPVVGPDEFSELVQTVAEKIKAEDFQPDTILGLSTGGLPTAAFIAKKLGVQSRNVFGLPVYQDDKGEYHLVDDIVQLGDCTGKKILVVDEATNSGQLIRRAVAEVTARGGEAKSCVLIANDQGILPDIIATTCAGNVPEFFWER
jgi:hypoxanthine phosphoribosyltransferase